MNVKTNTLALIALGDATVLGDVVVHEKVVILGGGVTFGDVL